MFVYFITTNFGPQNSPKDESSTERIFYFMNVTKTFSVNQFIQIYVTGGPFFIPVP